jgi:hypothetical protein
LWLDSKSAILLIPFLYKQPEQNPTGRAIANYRPPPFSPSPTPDKKHFSFGPPKIRIEITKTSPKPILSSYKSFQIN